MKQLEPAQVRPPRQIQPGGEGEGPPELSRVPAYDVRSEAAVLGGMIFSSGSAYDVRDDIREVLDTLGPHVFYYPPHSLIYRAVCDLHGADEPTGPNAVINKLREMGELDRVGGPGYIHQLMQATASVADSLYEAIIIRDLARRRRIEESLIRCQQYVGSGEGSASEVAAFVQQQVEEAVDDAVPDGDTSLAGDVLRDVIDDLDREPVNGLVGLPTGFADLDGRLGGLIPGEFIVVAARPAMGKTTLVLDFVRKNAVSLHTPVLMFSLEMLKRDLVVRMISAEQRVPLHHLRNKQMTDEDWTKTAIAAESISRSPFYINDGPDQSIGEIESTSRKYVRKHGVKLIIVDYMQLVKVERSFGNDTQDVSRVSNALRGLAKSLEIPIVALSQLNRGPESRESKIPNMGDLRQSGQIEQDAHNVILLHRDDAYDKDSPRAGEADLIIAKARSAPTGTVTVAFQGHYSRFMDMCEK